MSILHTRIRKVSSRYNSQGQDVVEEVDVISPARVTAFCLATLVILILVMFSFLAIGRTYGRAQKRADARNSVKVTTILIQKARQQARITNAQIAATRARAQMRYQESVGIRRAQDEIQKTLTPLYVQHEAIQAQERIATSGKNNTVIYVPAGTNGTPTITANANRGK